ncbi:trypsin-like peptidase domain-containing protein [soil metagenome]
MIDQPWARAARPSIFERGRALVLAMAMALTLGIGAGALVGDGLLPAAVSAQATGGSQSSVSAVATAANPAVVTVTTLQEMAAADGGGDTQGLPPGAQHRPGEDGQLVPLGSGSGFIVDDAGHVVTNAHVVASGSAFEVTYFDGTTVTATLVGSDPFQDVAVLKIELAAGETVLGVVPFGDSELVQAGDPVVAIGNPYGEYANTVTSGIVNAMERGLDSGGGYDLPNLIQHDADIYPGNSGGPLLNASGEVIGINVAKAFTGRMGMDSDGFNFAIESNAASQVVQEIIADGSFERSYLGIRGQATQDGVQIVSLERDGPAAAAGLLESDIIAGIVGQAGDDPNEALDVILFEMRPGDVVTLEVLRGGQSITVDVNLGERPGTITS